MFTFFMGIVFTILALVLVILFGICLILLSKIDDIQTTVNLILKLALNETPSVSKLEFYIDGKKVEDMQVRIGKKIKATLVAKDAGGNVAQFQAGSIQAALTAPELGSVEVKEDGTVEFTPAGQLGSCELQVSVDADLGEGVKTIQGVLPVEVIAGEAVTVELTGEEI